MKRAIGVLMATERPLCSDGNCNAFINAAGITNATQKAALCTLVTNAKINGWWTLCSAIYPFVGGTASTHKWNLKDPRDLDAAFRLVFNGGWTHSSTGALPNGTTGYADTFLIPSVNMSLNSAHISYYSRTSSAIVDSCEISSNQSNPTSELRVRDNDLFRVAMNEAVIVGAINTNSQGCFAVSRTGSADINCNGYINGVQTHNTQASVSRPTISFYLAAKNNSGTADTFSDKECAFATLGAGLSSAIVLAMYNDIQTFQTALSRQV